MTHRWVTVVSLLAISLRSGSAPGSSLRFHGHGVDYVDRVEIALEGPEVPADTATAGDFTIEWWMKASAAENLSGGCSEWICGNILIDRDIFATSNTLIPQKWGISMHVSGASGRVRFGGGSYNTTIQGSVNVADSAWHHVAVTRRASDGQSCVFVDGALDVCGAVNSGSMEYPDGLYLGSDYGLSGPGIVNKNPFLVLGAEKHDYCQHASCGGERYPAYSGSLDELRLSSTIRYTGAFSRPSAPFATDASTSALYHFDEGSGTSLGDVSGAAGGPSNGSILHGGSAPAGPVWSTDSPFAEVPSATSFHPVVPCRLFDTRVSSGPSAGAPILAAGATRTVDVTGLCSLPATARTLSVNQTVTGQSVPGDLVLYRGDLAPAPVTSNLSFRPGVTRANNGLLELARDGSETFKILNRAPGPVHFVLDVNGYFE